MNKITGPASKVPNLTAFLQETKLLLRRAEQRMNRAPDVPLGELRAIQDALTETSARLVPLTEALRAEAARRGLSVP